MKNLIKQENFKNDSLLTEKMNMNISKYNSIYTKTIKDLKLNLYFITTFGTTLPVFFPIFEKLVKNSNLEFSLTSTDIVLLTICAIGILVNENSAELNKVRNIINEKGYSELIDKFVNFITNINSIFSSISKNVGKIVITVNSYNIGLSTFGDNFSSVGFTISTGIGVLTISAKHFITSLIKKIKRLRVIKESLDIDLIIKNL